MGISFLTPLLLAGAAAVAVPVVLHLMMRRKPVPYDFPALRFLQERAVANRRRLHLNHLLLLLLRMAAGSPTVRRRWRRPSSSTRRRE